MNKIISLFITAFFLLACSFDAFSQEENYDISQRKLSKADRQMLKDSINARRKQMALEKQAEKEFWKRERAKSKIKPVSEEDVIYIFGVGTNFNDSTIYLTEITPIQGLRLDPKTNFLPGRTDFSLQFREYLEGQLGLVYETTCVFYSVKRAKAQKYAYKLRRRYLDKGYKDLIVVDPQKFTFKLPDYLTNQQNSNQ